MYRLILDRNNTAVDCMYGSDGKIDSNRFTLPNRSEKNSIQYHSYNALATCITVL